MKRKCNIDLKEIIHSYIWQSPTALVLGLLSLFNLYDRDYEFNFINFLFIRVTSTALAFSLLKGYRFRGIQAKFVIW